MASISSEPWRNAVGSPRSEGLKRFLRSRWTFVGLQVLDLLTTMYAFRAGAIEVNPLVAHLTVVFGRFGGVLMSAFAWAAAARGLRCGKAHRTSRSVTSINLP